MGDCVTDKTGGHILLQHVVRPHTACQHGAVGSATQAATLFVVPFWAWHEGLLFDPRRQGATLAPANGSLALRIGALFDWHRHNTGTKQQNNEGGA